MKLKNGLWRNDRRDEVGKSEQHDALQNAWRSVNHVAINTLLEKCLEIGKRTTGAANLVWAR